MPQDATSLDRLNDIVVPAGVSWWPLAPGWYVLAGMGLVVAGALIWRWLHNWKLNAYRRAALRELARMESAASIAELLRRTSLATMPRATIANSTGVEWADWLAAQCAVPLLPQVRDQLIRGIYQRTSEQGDVSDLRNYAAQWIAHHQTTSSRS